MRHFTRENIEGLGKYFRANLINSITGIKPANLIGTQNQAGLTNLAIFTSVVHLGSNPPLLGMIFRPVGEVQRHTYQNIQSQKQYTINALPIDQSKAGHYTSAKFEKEESEFEQCGFTPLRIDDFEAPFVKESPLRIGMSWVEEIPIKRNDTILMIGEVEHLMVENKAISEEGYLNLETLEVAGVSGLNSYYRLHKENDYPYAKKTDWQGV